MTRGSSQGQDGTSQGGASVNPGGPPPDSTTLAASNPQPKPEAAPKPTGAPQAGASQSYHGLTIPEVGPGRAVTASAGPLLASAKHVLPAANVPSLPPPELPAFNGQVLAGPEGSGGVQRPVRDPGGPMPLPSSEPRRDARGPRERVAAAESLLDLGDFEGALREAEAALELDSSNVRAFQIRAEALNRLKRWGEAELAAWRAAELSREDPEAFLTMAWAQLHQDKLEEALRNASAAIRKNPADARSYLTRALAYERLGRRDLMLTDLRAASALDSGYRPLLEKARAGEALFRQGSDNFSLLGRRRRGRPSAPVLPWALGSAAAALLAGAGWQALRRRRPPASAAKAALLAGKYPAGRALGASASVWETEDVALRRPVTVRRLDAAGGRAELKERLRRAASVRHPNLAEIYEIIEREDGLYVAGEMVSGISLAEMLSLSGPLPPARAARVLASACAAVAAAHDGGLAHGRLTAANIKVADGGHVKVLDLGMRPDGGGPGADVRALADCLRRVTGGAGGPLPPGPGRLSSR